MFFRKALCVATLALVLVSCQTGSGVKRDQHTGNVVAYSARYSIQDGLLYNVHARAFHSKIRGYAVNVDYLGTGGSWLFLSSAWSFGKQYRYQVEARHVVGCAAGCTLSEVGTIFLTEADFNAAAANGFAFKVVGRGGSIEGKLPAKAFQEVLNPQKS